MRVTAICLWTGLCFAAPVLARDIYVNNTTGDDRYDGASQKNQEGRHGAVRSLQRAVRIARPGDRIVVVKTALPLRESVVIDGLKQPGGTPGYAITIEGNGATLDGTIPVEPGDGNAYENGLFRLDTVSGPTHARDWLFVDGAPAPRGQDGVGIDRPTLAVGQFGVWQGWFAFRVAPGKTLVDYRFAFSRRPCGIAIYRSNFWRIRDLNIRGFRGEGAQVRGPCSDVLFDHCQFEYNGNAGLAVGNLAEPVFTDCYSIANGRAGVIANNRGRPFLNRVKLAGNPKDIVSDGSTKAILNVGGPTAPEWTPPQSASGEEKPTDVPEPKRRSTPKTDDDL